MSTEGDRLKALESEVDLLKRDLGEACEVVRALRTELEQKQVIGVPNRVVELPIIDEVPLGHGRGHCEECGGFHPVDGAPRAGN